MSTHNGNSNPPQMPISKAVKMAQWLSEKLHLLGNVDSAKGRKVFRGQVYWCKFGENIGSEQCLERPAVILSNNPANLSSSNVIVAPITNTGSTSDSVYALNRPSTSKVKGYVLLGNIVTVSKARLGDYIDKLDSKTEIPKIEEAMYNSLGVAGKIVKIKDQLDRTTKYLETVKQQRNKAEDELKEIKREIGLKHDDDITSIISVIRKLNSNEKDKE